MVEFEQIAGSEAAAPMYRTVVSELDIENHSSFLFRPIKVLDLGGGTGTIGDVMKGQLEESFGPLSPAELVMLVDYVNIDENLTALSKSPGRTVHTGISRAYHEVGAEDPFDFVLSVNAKPSIPAFTFNDAKRNNAPSEIVRLVGTSPKAIGETLARISLISTALVLQEGGKYIHLGFMEKGTLDGIVAYIRENGLGLRLEKDEKIELPDQVRDMFVEVDTGKKPGSRSFEKVRATYKDYRLMVMRMKQAPDKQRLKGLLDEEVRNYRSWTSFCEVQDRFGSW
ncbi:MAG TPA: hypothetical protein VIK81_02020 [Patescibacteria group bacterium]